MEFYQVLHVFKTYIILVAKIGQGLKCQMIKKKSTKFRSKVLFQEEKLVNLSIEYFLK